MKGEEKLWGILNDKLETLRASSRLPEAIRVAETLLELAKRTFRDDDNALAISYEKLGTLLDQAGDRVKAKPYLLKAHGKATGPTLALSLGTATRVLVRQPWPAGRSDPLLRKGDRGRHAAG